jgi:hypothetical protein
LWTSTRDNLSLEGLCLTAFNLWISRTNAHRHCDRLSFTNGCFRQWCYWSMSTDALSKKFIGSSLAKEEVNSTMTYFISLEQLPYVAWLLPCYWTEFKKYWTIFSYYSCIGNNKIIWICETHSDMKNPTHLHLPYYIIN